MKSIFDYFTKTASNAAVAMNEDEELAEEGVPLKMDGGNAELKTYFEGVKVRLTSISGRSKQHHRLCCDKTCPHGRNACEGLVELF